MTTPMFSVTGDDSRYYEWPKAKGNHLPSITTQIKQGIPKPVLQQWAVKKTAQLAIAEAELFMQLIGRSRADS